MSGPGWSRGLRHTRFQRILAIAAIGAAVALPVVLVSVGGGVSDHELAALQNAGYQIVVSAAGLHGITGAHPLTERILRVPGVTFASPVLSLAVDAFNSSGNVSPVLAEGVVPRAFTATLGPTENGVFPTPLPLGDPNDTAHYDDGTYAGPASDDVVVSAPYADQFHVRVGDQILLAPADNASDGTEFTVTETVLGGRYDCSSGGSDCGTSAMDTGVPDAPAPI